MHELSVCQALLRQAGDIATQHHAARITRIVLGIGPLSGVEPNLLVQAFPIAAAGGIAADAELEIQPSAVRVHCRSCGADSDAAANRLLCGACGDWHTDLIAGDELLLISLELQEQEQHQAANSGKSGAVDYRLLNIETGV